MLVGTHWIEIRNRSSRLEPICSPYPHSCVLAAKADDQLPTKEAASVRCLANIIEYNLGYAYCANCIPLEIGVSKHRDYEDES